MLSDKLPALLLRTLAVGYLSYYVFDLRSDLAWFAVVVLLMQTIVDWSNYLYRRGRASAHATSGQTFHGGR